jgi:tetratricopeptide (TPR) repeat protein
MRHLLVSALAVGLGVVIATSLKGRATTDGQSDLLPDPSVVRYRFSTQVEDDRATMAALEARVRTPVASPSDVAELAELHLRRNDFARADELTRRSLEVLRTPNPSLLVRAKLANATHDFHGAIALAREALEHKQTAGAFQVIATAELALGDLTAAGEAADAALSLKPDTGGYFMRALIEQAQGRDAEAGFDFARAAALEDQGAPSEAARLRALWGRFLMRRGEHDGAARLFTEALRISPGQPLATALRGELALRTGDLKKARALYERAFADSGQLRYLIDQARVLQLAGEDAKPLRTQIVRMLRDEGVGHRLELVEVLLDLDDAKEALALAREELAARPSVDVRFQLARALARTHDLDRALSQVRAALATGAKEAQLYELAARLERTHGNAPRAELYAREARKLDPGHSGWREAAAR